MSWLFWVRRLLNTTHATPCCEKKIVRRSSGGGWGESVSIALKVGVSENKAEILALSSISKIVQCNLTSYLVSYIIRPEYLVSQTCKTPVLGDITTLWLNISPFQWRFNMSLCDITWHGDILFNKRFVISPRSGVLHACLSPKQQNLTTLASGEKGFVSCSL